MFGSRWSIDKLIACVFFMWASCGVGTAKKIRNYCKGIELPHKDHNMVIFGLDRTIWPFKVNKLNKSFASLSEINTTHLGNLTLFPESHTCLDSLQKLGYVLAAVCNCKIPKLAENLLDAFDLTRYFAYQVCVEADKLGPLETLHTQSGVDFEDMLYFDYDLRENLPLFDLNITFIPVDDRGISMEAVEKALALFNVRTTLKPPLTTTMKQKKNINASSEYSLEIDYKNLDFKKPNTEEILNESSEEEDS